MDKELLQSTPIVVVLGVSGLGGFNKKIVWLKIEQYLMQMRLVFLQEIPLKDQHHQQ